MTKCIKNKRGCINIIRLRCSCFVKKKNCVCCLCFILTVGLYSVFLWQQRAGGGAPCILLPFITQSIMPHLPTTSIFQANWTRTFTVNTQTDRQKYRLTD